MEGRLVRPQWEMPVDSVVTKIRLTPHKPLRERRLAEIANFAERFVPINCFGLFRPERFTLFQGTTTELQRLGWFSHWGRTIFRECSTGGVGVVEGCSLIQDRVGLPLA